MNKLKYGFSHGKIILLAGIVILCLVTSGIFEVVSQLRSANDGIEILLIDTMVSSGTNELTKSVRKHTGIKYVGVSTLNTKDAEDYVKTIENYTMSDYLDYLVASKDAEIIFVTESKLEAVYSMTNIVPLEISGEFPELCFNNGVVYAFPLENTFVAEYESNIISLQENTYAVLTGGDHLEEARGYISSLPREE